MHKKEAVFRPVTGWKKQGHFLVKKIRFKTFVEAVGFVNIVATIAEELSHHPDITIKDYNFVEIKTSTHKAGKLTEKDFELAEHINRIPK